VHVRSYGRLVLANVASPRHADDANAMASQAVAEEASGEAFGLHQHTTSPVLGGCLSCSIAY
jgi:hypothetical protein